MLEKQQKRQRRHKAIRAKIYGTKEKPRLCVFKSSRHIYVQLIDDEKNKVLATANDSEVSGKGKKAKDKKVIIAKEVGKLIAEKAKKIKTEKVAFDRGGFIFHGRIKALAEGAREGGLKF